MSWAQWVTFVYIRQARHARAVFSEKRRKSFSVERLYQLRAAGERIGSYLISIFETLGNITYMGCGMTILEHALQCATVAEAEGGDLEEVQFVSVATVRLLSAVGLKVCTAFLYEFGELLNPAEEHNDDHDRLGAEVNCAELLRSIVVTLFCVIGAFKDWVSCASYRGNCIAPLGRRISRAGLSAKWSCC